MHEKREILQAMKDRDFVPRGVFPRATQLLHERLGLETEFAPERLQKLIRQDDEDKCSIKIWKRAVEA